MEISLKTLKRIGIVLLLLALIAVTLLTTSGTWMPYMPWYETPPLGPDQIAMMGAERFFSMDIDKGSEVWLAEICEISTELACFHHEEIFLGLFWPSVERDQKRIETEALTAELFKDYTEDITHYQAFEVELISVDKDTREENMGTFFVLVSEWTKDDWKFNRVLFDAEVEEIKGK
ncbi:MAG: hypothetical protein JEZ06_15100 [Anaerolineaceae bacterium]|nr:hypothetical protein [Anaerolineaceae bacterium]